MMTPAMKWAIGLGPKPELVTFVPSPVVFEKVYPAHRYSHEVDPTKRQCGCGTVTDWVCESCDELYCESCMGSCSSSDGPVDKNFCESCMDSYMNQDYDY